MQWLLLYSHFCFCILSKTLLDNGDDDDDDDDVDANDDEIF